MPAQSLRESQTWKKDLILFHPIVVLESKGKGYGMEHNRGILRNAKKLVSVQDWKNSPTGSVQFIDDSQLFLSLMLDQLLLVICVLISLKGAHYSTHFQVDLELLLLILWACESLEKTKSEIETIHRRELGKDLTPVGKKADQ